MINYSAFNKRPNFRFGGPDPLILEREEVSQPSGLGSMTAMLKQKEIDNAKAAYAKTVSSDPSQQVSLNPGAFSQIPYNNNDTGVSDGFFNTLSGVESRGDYNAKNASGATGKYQFFKSTATPYLKKHGRSWDEFQKNPNLQEAVVRDFTRDNASTLKKANVPVNDFTAWVAHNQGAKGAIDMLKHGKGNTKNIASNLPKGMKPTVANYVSYWKDKFPGSYDNSIFANKTEEELARLKYEQEEMNT